MPFRRLRILAMLVASFTVSALQAAEQDQSELVRMFAWWNTAMAQPDGFTEAGFARHYTDDAAIIVNNRVLARGIGEMVAHFREIQQNTQSVEIILPFEEEFRQGNKLFTHHRVEAMEDGRRRESHVMGYATVEDGRISLINFITHSEYEQ